MAKIDVLTIRDIHFDFTQMPRFWLNGDVYVTHMFNASSVGFPAVEQFVIQAVKSYIDKIQLQELHTACLGLIKQEAMHSREHGQYNQRLIEQKYDVAFFAESLHRTLHKLKKKYSPLFILAVALGFESFTTIVCKQILEKDILLSIDNETKRFWKWHTMEELEHKSVLMDLYKYVGGGYVLRVSALTLVLLAYCYYGIRIYSNFLRHDKVSVLKGLVNLFWKNTFFVKSLLKALACYRYSYCPGKLDCDHLLEFESII